MKINKEFTDVHCCYEFIITYILYIIFTTHRTDAHTVNCLHEVTSNPPRTDVHTMSVWVASVVSTHERVWSESRMKYHFIENNKYY